MPGVDSFKEIYSPSTVVAAQLLITSVNISMSNKKNIPSILQH